MLDPLHDNIILLPYFVLIMRAFITCHVQLAPHEHVFTAGGERLGEVSEEYAIEVLSPQRDMSGI